MISLLAIALLAQTPQHRLFLQPNMPRASFAEFEFAPANGAGMPAVAGCYAASAITEAHGGAATFARADSELCPSADGQTWTTCSAGQVCITTGSQTTSELGPLVWPAATNQVIYPSDLAQADWVKTNVTCTKTITGPTGVANSASTCSATSNGGTVKQTGIPGLAGTNLGSWFIKRRTGTGAVSVTMNDFAAETDITASLSSTRWRRVVPTVGAVGCAGGDCIVVPDFEKYTSPARFTIGLKFATSGDAVDLWAAHVENLSGSDVTAGQSTVGPPIDTNAAATRGTRVADNLYITPVAAFRPACMSAQVQTFGAPISITVWLDATDGTNFLRLNPSNGATSDQRMQCTRNISAVATTSGGVTPIPMSAATLLHAGCTFTPAGVITTYNRVNAETTTATSGDLNPLITKVQIGGRATSTGIEAGGVYHRVKLDSDASRCAYTSSGTGGTPIAWVGDSNAYGNAGSSGTGVRPPHLLETALTVATADRANYNYAVGGYRTDQCLNVWRNNVRGKGFSTLILVCGVNSAIQGTPATAAEALAQLTTILDEAKADGMKVIPTTILPFGGNVNWSAPRQTYIETINTGILAWCTVNGVTCLDAYTEFLGVSPAMNTAYDNADALHLDATGSAHFVTLVQALTP